MLKLESTEQNSTGELEYWQELNAKTCESNSIASMGAWSEWDKITDGDD